MTYDVPAPGPDEPVPSWPEYDHLREAVETYLDHEPPDPQYADIWRALASIMGEYQRDAFLDAFDMTSRPRRRVSADSSRESPSVHTTRSKPTTIRRDRHTSHQPAAAGLMIGG